MCTYDAYMVPIPHNDDFSASWISEGPNPFMEGTDDHLGYAANPCVRVCAMCALENRNGVCERAPIMVSINTQHLIDFQSSLSCLEPRKVVCT